MKYVKILLLLLIIQSCTKTKTEKDKHLANIGKDERLANIKVNIFIGDDNDPKNFRIIHLRALDGEYINSKNTILLNNQPFTLVTRKSNYYMSYSDYVLSEYKKDEAYLFEIILTDSSRHTLAYIKPRKDYKELNYAIPKHFSSDENLELKWENIYVPTNLEVQKQIYEIKYPRSTRVKHYVDYKITEKSGSYILDKSVFKDSLEVTVGIEANFSVREKGGVNPNLRSGSTLIYENKVIKKSILKK